MVWIKPAFAKASAWQVGGNQTNEVIACVKTKQIIKPKNVARIKSGATKQSNEVITVQV